MAKPLQLKVQTRKLTGRKVKKLRREGLVPANIFGKNIKSHSIKVDQSNFCKIFEKVGETSITELLLDKEKSTRPVLISNVQKDPLTDQIIHVDFHQVDLKEKVTASVPLEFVGESVAVKEKGGLLNQVLSEVEVEALPTDLVERIVVDLSKLTEIGSSLYIKDLQVPSNISLSLDENSLVVAVVETKKDEEETEKPAEAEDGAPEAEAEEKNEAKPKENSAPKEEAKKDTSTEKKE